MEILSFYEPISSFTDVYEDYSKNILLDNLYNKEEWLLFYQYKPQDFINFDNLNHGE